MCSSGVGTGHKEKEMTKKILESIDQIADRDHREVVIPDGYTEIGEWAFYGGTAL